MESSHPIFKREKVGVKGHTSTLSSQRPTTATWKGGLYLKATLADQTVHCLLDTGANRSILHPKVYYGIPDSQ